MALLMGMLATQQEQAKAFTALAGAMTAWIGSFRVDAPPEVRQSAEALAWEAETTREMEAQGLPVGATELDRLRWIAMANDFSA